jgi:hypothetical protein
VPSILPVPRLSLGAAMIVSCLACLSSPCAAQSTNAKPDLTKGDSPLDPVKLSLPDAAKKVVTQAQADMKAGKLAGFVFAASPDMKVWAINAAAKDAAKYDPVDLARTALEGCEFGLGAPCAILSIDGLDTRGKNGLWAKQPAMLNVRPSDFDSTALPFVAAAVRSQTADYGKATGARAFAVTTGGGWLWRSGPNVAEAINRTMTDCAAQFHNGPCILYAVNGRVVFGAR